MSDVEGFDSTFDFRTEAGVGGPDSASPTLKAYHKAPLEQAFTER